MASTALPRPRMQRAPVRRTATQSDGGLWRIMPLVLLVYSTLVPLEVRFDIADQTIYPYRMAIFALLPWLLQRLAAGAFRFRNADLLMFMGCAWMVLSFIVAYGYLDGFLRGGAIVIDTLGPYLIARIAIRELVDVRRLLVAVVPGLLFTGVTMLIESVTHVQFVRPAAAEIFGALSQYENGIAIGQANRFTDVRLGLLRAAGPFSHPILAGLFLGSFFGLYLRSGLRGWPRIAGVAAAMLSFFSVSSAALLGLLVVIALTAYDALQRWVEFLNWRAFLFAAGLLALFIQIFSQSGIISIVIRMSLNPGTGYYRRLIWQYGTESVSRHPWFGIAYENYERLRWMNSSVDNYWLVLAIRHGLATPALFLIATIVAVVSSARTTARAPERDQPLLVAISVALFTVAIMGFTVAFFGGMLIWFYVLLGMALSIGQQAWPVPMRFVPVPPQRVANARA